jgi:PmbA protein
MRAEAAAFAVDKRITNSEGANTFAQQSHFVLANSRGFIAGYPYSRHSLSVSPIAGKGNNMQRDGWYSSDRNPKKLADPEAIGRYAAERALSRLNARQLDTRKCPVLFEAPQAVGLIGAFVQAVSGGALYRKSTFLTDSLGTEIFGPDIQIIEDPHQLGGVGSAPFDDEGVPGRRNLIIENGVLQTYLLHTYTARKLGRKTTGNASRGLTGSPGTGHGNLYLEAGALPPEELLRQVGHGLYVTELIGQGVNTVNGDYSRGASGIWIENGELTYPVTEVTVAGNLSEMLKNVLFIGNDLEFLGSTAAPTLALGGMTVSGVQ